MLAENRDDPPRDTTEVSEHLSVDVAVVGGGPAGTAAALTLLRYSALRVALAERSAYASFRIGECLSPGADQLLRYLGAEEVLSETEACPAEGVCAAWGSSDLRLQDFFFTGRGPGWHLDRRRFDQALANLVGRRGGVLLTDSRVTQAVQTAEGAWCLAIRKDGGRHPVTLEARYVIDATGRRALIARGQAAMFESRDRLVGISGLFTFRHPPTGAGFTLVEAVPSGWWYTAPLPGNRMVAVFMTDADIARRDRYQEPGSWKRSLAASVHARERLKGSKPAGPLHLHAAYSGKLSPPTGPGWIAAGEAAVTFDPLASMGIGHALLTGIEAGRVAHNVLSGSGRKAPAYAEGVANHFARYLDLRAAYYSMEQRWCEQPFWRRRHQGSNKVPPSDSAAS